MTDMLGIYIHIPFCVRKCAYCDFNSRADSAETMERYTEALIHQIHAAPGGQADSVFIGGGTPTVLPVPLLEKVLEAVFAKFTLVSPEITMEANPATVKDFAPYRAMGINRVSIGLQSVNEEELRELGRIHTFADFLECYELAQRQFDNINVDTMFGIPRQTRQSWQNTLSLVTELKPSHISAYSLIVEPGTPFASMALALPDEDTVCDLYDDTIDFLADKGYPQYEISNFGRPCRHNLKYWHLEEYIGFGAGAHSFFDGKRVENVYSIDNYIQDSLQVQETILSKEDLMSEFCFLALRTNQGIDTALFQQKFGVDFHQKYRMERFLDGGFLEYLPPFLSLTDTGRKVSNQIMCEFV